MLHPINPMPLVLKESILISIDTFPVSEFSHWVQVATVTLDRLDKDYRIIHLWSLRIGIGRSWLYHGQLVEVTASKFSSL